MAAVAVVICGRWPQGNARTGRAGHRRTHGPAPGSGMIVALSASTPAARLHGRRGRSSDCRGWSATIVDVSAHRRLRQGQAQRCCWTPRLPRTTEFRLYWELGRMPNRSALIDLQDRFLALARHPQSDQGAELGHHVHLPQGRSRRPARGPRRCPVESGQQDLARLVFGRSSAQMIRFGRANSPIRSATVALDPLRPARRSPRCAPCSVTNAAISSPVSLV